LFAAFSSAVFHYRYTALSVSADVKMILQLASVFDATVTFVFFLFALCCFLCSFICLLTNRPLYPHEIALILVSPQIRRRQTSDSDHSVQGGVSLVLHTLFELQLTLLFTSDAPFQIFGTTWQDLLMLNPSM
jgi:hypothetical protein